MPDSKYSVYTKKPPTDRPLSLPDLPLLGLDVSQQMFGLPPVVGVLCLQLPSHDHLSHELLHTRRVCVCVFVICEEREKGEGLRRKWGRNRAGRAFVCIARAATQHSCGLSLGTYYPHNPRAQECHYYVWYVFCRVSILRFNVYPGVMYLQEMWLTVYRQGLNLEIVTKNGNRNLIALLHFPPAVFSSNCTY